MLYRDMWISAAESLSFPEDLGSVAGNPTYQINVVCAVPVDDFREGYQKGWKLIQFNVGQK